MKDTYTREECAKYVEAVAIIMSKLYYCMAREMVSQLGEERGTEAVRRAVIEFGRMRGAQMREKADADGAEPTVAALGKYYDLPREVAWKNEVIRSQPQLVEKKATYCPFAEEWKRIGADAQKLGLIYCEQDVSLRLAFNPDFVFEQFSNVLEGHEDCHTILRHKDEK
ncbi:MAG: L-2-amino-thiazoline-4-carboxylic acid hydrolase [Bacillota bacterium]